MMNGEGSAEGRVGSFWRRISGRGKHTTTETPEVPPKTEEERQAEVEAALRERRTELTGPNDELYAGVANPDAPVRNSPAVRKFDEVKRAGLKRGTHMTTRPQEKKAQTDYTRDTRTKQT